MPDVWGEQEHGTVLQLTLPDTDSVSGFQYLHFRSQSNLFHPVPTLVYLHGAGEFGSDINTVTRYGLPLLIKQSKLQPACDVICPQMEQDKQWDVKRLHLFLGSLRNAGHEIVLAGYSRGGTGVCHYLANYGSSLSLAVVISGRGVHEISDKLDGLEIFSVMGDQDPWPDMNGFLAQAETKGANVADIRLANRGHYISEEVFLSGKLPAVLSRYQIILSR
ncbi:MAG: hypothetical protein AB8B97_18210 [Granulosicoccus sp.]